MEKLIRNLGKKILAITVACLVCFFSLPAVAQAKCLPQIPEPGKTVVIEGGSFIVDTSNAIPGDITVRSAIIGLPEGETGTIDSIVISRPYNPEEGCPKGTLDDGTSACIEFGCSMINVENRTNLIPACGGPAVLKAGETRYQAQGSHFGPQGTFDDFSVTLCDDYDFAG